MPADRVLTEPQFAEKIGLSLPTVRRKRKRGELEYIQLSEHRIGYRDSYAERLLDARTVKSRHQPPKRNGRPCKGRPSFRSLSEIAPPIPRNDGAIK